MNDERIVCENCACFQHEHTDEGRCLFGPAMSWLHSFYTWRDFKLWLWANAEHPYEQSALAQTTIRSTRGNFRSSVLAARMLSEKYGGPE